MIAITSGLTLAWGERAGWMLVHSVWEIALIATLYAIVLGVLPRSASAARYAAGFIALLCMIAALPVTFALVERNTSSQIANSQALEIIFPKAADQPTTLKSSPRDMSHNESNASKRTTAVDRAMIEPPTPLNRQASWQTIIVPLLPWLTTVWFAGVVLFSLRLIVGLAGVERLRRVGISDIGSEIGDSGRALASRLGIRQAVKFAESALVQVPTVIGYLRPVVLLPAVPLTGLSTREIEFLLAHELAHIRRHDYLHNIVQGVIETILFYHPVMWWVSSCVRRERENCCDDLVVSTLNSPVEYAKTLFALEQRRSIWRPSLAANDGRLLERIRRLIGSPVRTSLSRQWGKGLAGLVVLMLVSVPLATAILTIAGQREAVAAAEKEQASESARTDKASEQQKSDTPPAVRVVVGPNKKLTFEGVETDWNGVEALLEKVPARANTVLEVAISTEDVTVLEMNDAIGLASHYGRQFGFKYTSYIGVHPLGSKGSGTPVAAVSTKRIDVPKMESTTSANRCMIKFIDGGNIELIGVAPYLAKPNWWSPDGAPLTTPWQTSFLPPVESNQRVRRVFGLSFDNLPESIDPRFWRLRVNGQPVDAFTVGAYDEGKPVKGALSLSTAFDNFVDEATISLGVAAHKRRLVMSVDSTGKLVKYADKEWLAAPTKVFVAEHHEDTGYGMELETFIRFERPNSDDFDVAIVAIDLDGKEHADMGIPITHQGQVGYGLFVPISRVKEFRILARSIKTDYDWYTFEHVSLQSGHHTEPKARIDQAVDAGPQSQHLVFNPRRGMASETSWTDLVTFHDPGEKDGKPYERVSAHVALEGKFPIQQHGDEKPLFKIKLIAGSDDVLDVILTGPDGIQHSRVLHRGKPLSWKLNGNTYWILFPETNVALDQPSESPFATILVSRYPEKPESSNSSIYKDTEPPGESTDDSKREGR